MNGAQKLPDHQRERAERSEAGRDLVPWRHRLLWSALLVSAYAAMQVVGWQRSLIGTEIWGAYYASQPLSAQMEAIRNDLVHPPLAYLVMRTWFSVFGDSDNSAKSLPLVFTIPTIVAFTYLAARVTRCWRIASLLFSTAYLTVGAVPNQVRMYGQALLLTVIAILLWDKWRREPHNPTLISWGIVMVLLVYTHLFGTLFLVAFVIVNCIYGSRHWTFLLTAMVVAIIFLPWALYVFPVYQARGLDANLPWVAKDLRVAIARMPFGLMGRPLPFFAPQVRTWLVLLADALHLLLLVVAWRSIQRMWPPRAGQPDTTRWFWTVTLLAVIPIVLLFAFSVAVRPALQERFVYGVLPAYWLLVVLLSELGGRMGRVVLLGLVVPWAVSVVGTDVVLEQRWRPRPVRLATRILEGELGRADLVVCEGAALGNQFYWEWTRRVQRPARIRVLPPRPTNAWLSVLPQSELATEDLRGMDRVWLLSQTEAKRRAVAEFLAVQGFEPYQPSFPQSSALLAFSRKRASLRGRSVLGGAYQR